MTMSARSHSLRKMALPSPAWRSSETFSLLRFTVSFGTVRVESGTNGSSRRMTSPEGCSTLMTRAPKSARTQPAIGPAQVVVASTTTTP